MNQSNKTQFWAEIIEQQSLSELSIVAFCKANQLTVNTFYYWRKKLYGGEQQQVVHPILIEVSPKSIGERQSVMLSLPTGINVDVIIDQMKARLLSESLICADETTVQVLSEPGKTAQSKSYMWVYRSGEFHKSPVVIYDYQPGRGASCLNTFLGDYSGYLLSDGYPAYDTLKNVTQAGCMAHARRKFTDAQKAQPTKKVGRVEKALNYIGKLYGIERETRKLSPEKRRQIRQQKAKPILDEFHQWLVGIKETQLPKGKLGIAINYAINQWPKLLTYLEDGHISIDNNVTERDVRPFTTGRKNWMFSTSVDGAKASANLYSLVMTCRANDINPYFYFVHLFRELPKRSPSDDLTDLMPWNVEIS